MADLAVLGAIGIVIGLVLGLTGAGGSILAVPLLMAGMGWSLVSAAPVALIAVFASASVGAWSAWRRDIVRYRAALLMATLGLLLAPAGLAAARWLPVLPLTLAFAVILAVVALRLWRQAQRTPADTAVVRAALPAETPNTARASVCSPSIMESSPKEAASPAPAPNIRMGVQSRIVNRMSRRAAPRRGPKPMRLENMSL